MVKTKFNPNANRCSHLIDSKIQKHAMRLCTNVQHPIETGGQAMLEESIEQANMEQASKKQRKQKNKPIAFK